MSIPTPLPFTLRVLAPGEHPHTPAHGTAAGDVLVVLKLRDAAWRLRPLACLDIRVGAGPGSETWTHTGAPWPGDVLLVPLPSGPNDGPAEVGCDGSWPAMRRRHVRDAVLERLILRLWDHQRSGEPAGRVYAHLVSLGIARRARAHLLGRLPSDPTGLAPALETELRSLIERFIDAPLDDEWLAAACGLGLHGFQRRFRASFGTSVHQYLLHRRIERAKESLRREAAVPLAHLAHRLGFASQSHFTSSFAARTGMPPSRYRRLSIEPSAQACATRG